MPVTRPWPQPRQGGAGARPPARPRPRPGRRRRRGPGRRAGAALFLCAHQVTARAGRPRAAARRESSPRRCGPRGGPGARAASVARPSERARREPRQSPRRRRRFRPGRSAAPSRPLPPPPVVGPSTRLVDLAAPEQPLSPHDPARSASTRSRDVSGPAGRHRLPRPPGGHARRRRHQGAGAEPARRRRRATRFLREGQNLQKVTGDYTARVHGVVRGRCPTSSWSASTGPRCTPSSRRPGRSTTARCSRAPRSRSPRARGPARGRHHPPRPQARQRPADLGRAEGRRLRHRPGRRADPPHAGREHGRHAGYWSHRAGHRQRRPSRHRRVGLGLLCGVRRPRRPPLRRRQHPRHRAAHPRRPRGRGVRRGAPALPRGSSRCCAVPRPRMRPTGERDGAALLRLLDRSRTTSAVGHAGWDRLVGGGVR